MEKYAIITISDNDKDSIEQLGTKRKFWFTQEDGTSLFKVGRENTGENWVEVVAAKLCNLLEIPHAQYVFSIYNEFHGTATKNFVPNGARLVHGNELLAKVYEKLNEEYEKESFYKVRQYDLRLIKVLLSHKGFHPALDVITYEGYSNAFEMFIGYLIFDCLISNQDRHHENWGLIVLEDFIYLAPTFDHASGLGSKESDDKKQIRLSGKDPRVTVKKFVEKAKTPFYAKGEKLSTYEAVELCGSMNKVATIQWLMKIEQLDFNYIKKTFEKIPEDLITQTSIDFAIEMLKENRIRLIELKGKLENEQ